MSDSSDKDRCPSCGGLTSGSRWKCDRCKKLLPKGRHVLMLVVAIMVVVAAIGATMLLSPTNLNDQGANLSNRTIGSGNTNFWTTYPATHPNAGASFAHPSWVLQALQDGPVLIFAHTIGCAACAQQIPICQAVNASYAGQISYFDLLEGENNERLVQTADVYDPTGEVHYVPLIVIASQMKDASNNTVIVWHSWEGVVSQSALTSWLDDAIDHFVPNP